MQETRRPTSSLSNAISLSPSPAALSLSLSSTGGILQASFSAKQQNLWVPWFRFVWKPNPPAVFFACFFPFLKTEGCSVQYLKDNLNQAIAYIRPLQNDLQVKQQGKQQRIFVHCRTTFSSFCSGRIYAVAWLLSRVLFLTTVVWTTVLQRSDLLWGLCVQPRCQTIFGALQRCYLCLDQASKATMLMKLIW